AEVHAGQRNFAEARPSDSPDVANHLRQGEAAARPARGRDDAVRTALLAAGLHTECEGGTPRDARLNRQTARTMALPACRRERVIAIENERLLPIVRHDADAVRQLRALVRTPRRVAAGHDDARTGVVAGDPPDGLPCALVRARGHRARVDDDEI